MPRMSIMGAYRNIPDSISYIPKKGCIERSFTVTRATETLGNSGIRPIILRDADFGSAATFESLVDAIGKSGMRKWDAPANAWNTVSGAAAGISQTVWGDLRQGIWEDTEMVGCMIACIKHGPTAADFFISAAPNMIYKSAAKVKYNSQPPGDNHGTQVHSEMTMAAQLKAFADKIGTLQETPIGFQKHGVPITTMQKGPDFTDLVIEADLFIEKGSMCQGCSSTWDKEIGAGTYRI